MSLSFCVIMYYQIFWMSYTLVFALIRVRKHWWDDKYSSY